MKRFRKPLLVIDGRDGEDAAIERAFSIAKTWGAPLSVLGVVEPPSRPADDDRELNDVWYRMVSMVEAALRVKVRKLVDLADREGLYVNAHLRIGRPATSIVEHVVNRRHDLVIKASERHREKSWRSPYGADDRELLGRCPVPLWLLPRESGLRMGAVGVAIGPLEGILEPFNTRLLEVASSIAEQESCPLHVIHAWDLFEASVSHSFEALAEGSVRDLRGHLERVCRRRLAQLVESTVPSAVKTNVLVAEGRADSVIGDAISQLALDLVVMGSSADAGSVHRTGRTAHSMLDGPRTSLLTVHPRGFVRAASFDFLASA